MPPPISIRASTLKQFLPRSGSQLRCEAIRRSSFPVRCARPQHSLPTSSSLCPSMTPTRTFSSTSSHSKKKTKADRDAAEEEAPSKGSKGSKGSKNAKTDAAEDEAADPFDFSTLQAGIEKVLDRLKGDLSKLSTGGRFNPEVLADVRVSVSKEGKKTERLGDLAQVLPKGGRSLMILVGEKDHVKPIISAIQAARNLNLQPQQDATDTSQLVVPIPPPTKESRDQALAAARAAGDVAHSSVRNCRAAMQKLLRAMKIKKIALPDDLNKAEKEMEKVVEKGNSDVKKAVDAAKKAMEHS